MTLTYSRPLPLLVRDQPAPISTADRADRVRPGRQWLSVEQAALGAALEVAALGDHARWEAHAMSHRAPYSRLGRLVHRPQP